MYTKEQIINNGGFIRKKERVFFINIKGVIQEIELHNELIESLNKGYEIALNNGKIEIQETLKAREENIEKLKEKTKAYIYSKYDREDQATLGMRALKIVSKVLKGETLTTEDIENQKQAEDMEVFISAEIEKYKQEKTLILNPKNDGNNI